MPAHAPRRWHRPPHHKDHDETRKPLAFSLVSLLLAGCAVSPAYVAPGTPNITLASPQQAQFKGRRQYRQQHAMVDLF